MIIQTVIDDNPLISLFILYNSKVTYPLKPIPYVQYLSMGEISFIYLRALVADAPYTELIALSSCSLFLRRDGHYRF